jgi:hypothetical protein
MKKIFLISVFLGLAFSYGYGQTYYYKAVAEIDKNGAKSKASGGMWITFINNQNICYGSDENGYKSSSTHNYHFRKTQNETHVYQQFLTTPYGGGGAWMNIFYYFSSDFSKMQYYYKWGSLEFRTEYIRTDGPEEEYNDNIPTF